MAPSVTSFASKNRAVDTAHRAMLVLTSVPGRDVAESIARELLSARLAACVQMGQNLRSLYHWQGQIETADEIQLFIKTSEDRYVELEHAIRALHPYELPEIIAVPISHGFAPYIDWIAAETSPETSTPGA